MLPSSPHVEGCVDELLENGFGGGGKVLIDSSTIDPMAARRVHQKMEDTGSSVVDAPVSGGVKGAENGTLTFMVGGTDGSLEAAKPYLDIMGANVVHCGGAGAGQSTKLCNNLAMAVQMMGVVEATNLGVELGLDPQKLAAVMNTSTSRCWSSENYNPYPGIVDGAPASRGYDGGFGVALMLKDLKLATSASAEVNSPTPLGNMTKDVYSTMDRAGWGGKDFGSVLKFLKGDPKP